MKRSARHASRLVHDSLEPCLKLGGCQFPLYMFFWVLPILAHDHLEPGDLGPHFCDLGPLW